MKRVKAIATAMVLSALTVLGTHAAAQQTNVSERTFLTFSAAVEMPGVTLQPGTYVFKLADTPTRNVVQVWDQDEKNMIGQWLFVQSERTQVSGETVVMFRETREGATPAVQYWYFPGERIGKEFVYPKDQAERIAARTGMPVRSEDGIVEGAGLAGVQTETTITADADTTLQNAPAAAQPSAAAGSLAGNRGLPAQADADVDVDLNADADVAAQAQVTQDTQRNQAAGRADVDFGANRPVGTSGQLEGQTARNELPRTASPLALSGLLGLLSLAGAAGIRAIRR